MFRSKSKLLLFFVFLTAATFVSSSFSSVYAATPSDPNGGYRVTESGSGYADYVFSYAGTKADGADIDITAIIGVNLKTGTKAIFKYDSASKEYIRNATGEGADLDGCSDRIQGNNPNRTIQSGADLTNATLYSFERYRLSLGPIQREGSCGAQPSAETGFRKITLTADQKKALGQIDSATPQQPGDVPGQDKPTCGEGLQTGTGWIVCPIAEGADSFVVWVDSVLYDLLRVNELQADSGIQDGWRAFRNIASALIVVVALVMIASQIFSFEFMSAYTIKKILPRIFIAAIAIQLSWIIAEVLVGFFNALGDGVEAILYAPFPDIIKAVGDGGSAIVAILNEFNSSLDAASRGTTGGWADGILIGAALAGFFAAGGFWGILGMALMLVALAMVAFVTLVLRKVVILALVIVFPVAIVAWVLPNTQKWWSNWWGMFSKLLLMYPLVIGLLTIGKIFAWVAATGAVSAGPGAFLYAVTAQGGSQLAVLFIILVAYFGPYAFIPAMFKLSGGIFAKAATIMQGQGIKFGRKGAEYTKRTGTGWASSKYRAGDSSARGLFQNAAVRLGTGQLGMTRRAQVRMAATGQKYKKDRVDEANFLLEKRMEYTDPAERATVLMKEASSKNPLNQYTAQSAFDLMLKRGDWPEIEGVITARGGIKGEWWKAQMAEGDKFVAAKTARPDLAYGGSIDPNIDPGLQSFAAGINKITPQTASMVDKSFWRRITAGDTTHDGAFAAAVESQRDFLANMDLIRNNPQAYGNLPNELRRYLDTRFGNGSPGSGAGRGPATPAPTPSPAPAAPLPPGAAGGYPGTSAGPGGLWIPVGGGPGASPGGSGGGTRGTSGGSGSSSGGGTGSGGPRPGGSPPTGRP